MQRLARLFERRAHAFYNADQHQKRHRREGKQLREQHARQAINPARLRNAEGKLKELIDDTRATEQHDQRQTDHERRRDDWQYGQQTQNLLAAKVRARNDQRQHQAQKGRARCAQQRQPQRVPRHAAAAAAPQTARHQIPQFALTKTLPQRRDRPCAILIKNAFVQDPHHREKYEQHNQHDDAQQRRRDEAIPTKIAHRGDTVGANQDEPDAHQQRASAHAELATADLGHRGLQRLECIALRRNCKPLRQNVERARCPNESDRLRPRAHRALRRRRRVHRSRVKPDCRQQQRRQQNQPHLAISRNLDQRRGKVLAAKVCNPFERVKTVLQRVPRHERQPGSDKQQRNNAIARHVINSPEFTHTRPATGRVTLAAV